MKFTPERTEKIIDLIARGNYKEVAAHACGITPKTLIQWINEGQADIDKGIDSAKSAFCNSVKKAESEAESRNVAIIQDAAEKTWQAAAWWLERTRPHRYGIRQKIDIHTGLDEIMRSIKEIK
jgi:hypothetical protein